MPYSLGSFPVLASGYSVGAVTVSRSGLLTVFDCACTTRSREILRLAAVCSGAYAVLGVMMPQEDDTLRLKRSFTKSALAALGYDEPVSFHLIRAGDIYEDGAELASETGEPENTESRYAETEYTAPEPEDRPDDSPAAENACEDAQPEAEHIEPEDMDAEPEDMDIAGLQKSHASGNAPDPWALIPEEPSDTAEEPPVYLEPTPADTSGEQRFLPEPPQNGVPETGGNEFSDGWTRVETPGMFFSDLSVAEACESVSGALVAARDGFELLAVPISPEEPFPLMPVFCFGSSEIIAGREYIIFKIKDGNLTL